ncbi:MAG: hypothetical protein IAA97_08595 [Spirochaetes bacterium]|uniref:Uncharacterized protein n=1 Tax=Candidatus Ornithospirochaeta stercoripullorum TaxID=2840899 RepID=A0A9D9E1J5_9SPIO|nr:hypothetical protein [Candidatus Ornithospirochaeta stercoripullorum]
MIERLDSAVVDELLASGELTEAQIDMVGQMCAEGAKPSEIVSAVLDENYHASASVGIGFSSWGLLAGALGILFVVLVVLNKVTSKKKDDNN